MSLECYRNSFKCALQLSLNIIGNTFNAIDLSAVLETHWTYDHSGSCPTILLLLLFLIFSSNLTDSSNLLVGLLSTWLAHNAPVLS